MPRSSAIRRALKRRLPAPALVALASLLRTLSPARRARHRAREAGTAAAAHAVAPLGFTVHAGPFAGMRYLTESASGGLGPYLIGSYEEELHPHLERLMARNPSVVINIGAAEGYYAVGLALRLPRARVIAADVNPIALSSCRKLAGLNGVRDRVRIVGEATQQRLQRWLQRDALMLVDCEGCELDLLEPVEVPALQWVDLVVELHDFVDASTSETIARRFRETHTITIVTSTPRVADAAAYPALAALPTSQWDDVLDERRPAEPHPMRWAVLEAMAR